MDASVDAPSDVATDTPEEPPAACSVQTCSGMVDLKLGQTISSGDSCGNTCSYKVAGGGLTMCTCTFGSGCTCPDAGDQ